MRRLMQESTPIPGIGNQSLARDMYMILGRRSGGRLRLCVLACWKEVGIPPSLPDIKKSEA
jgi:hypothetical protein